MSIHYTNTISAEDYNVLRVSAGWAPIHPEQAAAGINGSSYIVAAAEGGKTVGTARLIWDGGYAALIKDVLVLPEYQGKGIGREMMNKIIAWLKEQLKPGYILQVDMMASEGKEPFYEKFGFIRRPRENRGSGMDLWVMRE